MKLQTILLFIAMIILKISQKNVTGFKILTKKQESNSKWSQRVIRTIKQDPRIYQIMLLTNYANADNLKVVQELQEHLPTLYFTDFYLEQEIQQLEKRNSLSNPRDTTLFILVESPDKNSTERIEKIMSFIKQLSTARIRPQCLIVRFLNSSQTSKYARFMQKMWQDLFLDITILDVTAERAVIHQFNPFASYKTRPFSGKTSLFPNKLKNLNGYPLKIGVLDRQPYIKLIRNSSRHVVDISGPDAEIGKIFAKMMNYRQVLVPSTKGLGSLYCVIDKITGLYSLLQKNIIQLIPITISSARNFCKNNILEDAIFTLDHYVAVTPNLKSKSSSIMIGTTFFSSILLTVVITIISWIMIRKMKFERNIWNLTVVIQILFGVSVDLQPRKLKERILFICLVIMYYYYSFNVFEMLTDFNFRMDQEREIKSLDDLITSGLQFSSEKNKISLMPDIVNESDFTNWLTNARATTREECMELLLEHKNITCIMRLTQAEWFAGFYIEQNIVKVVPEYIMSVGIGFYLEPGSPYVEKMRKIHRALTEFAIMKRWRMTQVPNATRLRQLGAKSEEDDDLQKSDDAWKIRLLLTGIITAGYLSSVFAFLIELVFNKWKKKMKESH